MPSILTVPGSPINTVRVTLPKAGLIIDSRVVVKSLLRRFDCVIDGEVLTVTKRDDSECYCFGPGWDEDVYFRIYDPSVEKVPEFTSKSYRYFGLLNERPPQEAEEIIVDSSVKVIREEAFSGCKMTRCLMGDNVKEIEGYAFSNCENLKHIRLSKKLVCIGSCAFWKCKSIECLFLAQNNEKHADDGLSMSIGLGAFNQCTGMKLLILPLNIDLNCVSDDIVRYCPRLLPSTVQYRGYPPTRTSCNQVKYWLKHRHDHLPLLRLCADPNTNASTLYKYTEKNGTGDFYHTDDDLGLTPLHVLTCYNGFVNDDAIIGCYSANPGALFMPDTQSLTPLDMLWNASSTNKFDIIVHLMQDLCIHRSKDRYTSSTKRKRKRGHVDVP